MRKLQLIFTLFFFTILFNACGVRDKQSSEIISENVNHINLTKKVSEVFDVSSVYKGALKLVSLKSKKNFVIGQIDKVVIYKNNIYILDKSIARKLFIFDIDGNPLNSFQGKDGDALYSVSDFSIDQDNLYILDEEKKAILVYDVLGRKLKKNIFIAPNNICNIEVVNGEIIGYRALVDDVKDVFDNATLFLFNAEGNIKDFWLPIDKQNLFLTRYSSDFPILQKDDKFVYISRFMDNYLYKYSSDTKKVSNSYILDFGSEDIPQKVKSINNDMDFTNELENGKYSYSMSGYAETKSLMKMQISRNGSIVSFLAVKNGNSFDVERITYKDSLLPILSVNQLTEDLFVSSIPLDILSSLKSNIPSNKPGDAFSELLKDYDTKNGNPIIILINK